MNSEQILKVEKSIKNLKEKKSKVFFFVQDTKGNAKASIAYIYRMAYALHEQNFNVVILHEKNDYIGVGSWLDEKYTKLPHFSVESQNLEIAPEDFIVVPELFGFVMSQITKLGCGKIVLCQSYDYITETLNPGESWGQLGFHKCIATSDMLKEHITNIMRNTSVDVIQPYISDVFTKLGLPAKPVIALHTRDQREGINFIKTFYLKFPQFRWVSFRDMRGLSESEFAKNMQECFLSVWIDDISSYGTFPLESMKMGIPVMGLVPNLVPEWMNENNGLWINNKKDMVDFVSDYLQNWLEDNVNEEIFNEMEKTISSLQTEESFNKEVVTIFDSYLSKRAESMEEQINKFKETETNGEV
jgi:hypothetical protein